MVDSLRRRLPEMVEALDALVGAESPSADPAACEACAFVAEGLALELVGRSAERVVVDGRTHLRWRFGEQGKVLLVGHLDTVWPSGTVARWPFEVRDDRASGPGAFDMKAGVVQLLVALALVGEHRGLDGVTVVLTTDEEIGSPTSRGLLAEEARGVRAALIAEPSFDGALKTERKGVALYRLEAVGRAAHAGLTRNRASTRLWRSPGRCSISPTLRPAPFGDDDHSEPHLGGNSGEYVPSSAVAHFDVRFATGEEGRTGCRRFRCGAAQVPGAVTSVEQETFVPPLDRAPRRSCSSWRSASTGSSVCLSYARRPSGAVPTAIT